MAVRDLPRLLIETAQYQGAFGAIAPSAPWWDWNAAYTIARESGSPPQQAAAAAGRSIT